ncbi:WRKY transcription factor, partial [Trifolium medium]|nr:WRKY transcription factor [Trifolium medium]
MVELMECDKKAQKICNNGVVQEKMERDDNEIPQAMKGFPGWLSNNVSRLNSFKGVDDQGTESMIKKARVSVRARSEATM